jgi:hypothetical protein
MLTFYISNLSFVQIGMALSWGHKYREKNGHTLRTRFLVSIFFLISFRPHTVHGIWHGVAPMSPEPLRLIRGRSGPSDGPGPPTTAGCLLPSHPLPWGRADLQLEQADGLGALAAQCSEEVTALAVGQRALLEVCGIAGLGA